MKKRFIFPPTFAAQVLSLMLAATSEAHAQIGYELLPASMKATLELPIPAVRWRDASPKDSLNDIIEKLNVAVPEERRLKLLPFKFKARGEAPWIPRHAEPLFPLFYPENTVTFSGRQCKARDLIRLVCEKNGLSVAAYGEEHFTFTQVDGETGGGMFTERIAIPPSVRQDLAIWTDYSWLQTSPWKTRFLLRATLPLQSKVVWSNRDTALTVTAEAFAIWRIQNLARSAPFPDSSGQLSDSERRLAQSLVPMLDFPADLALPDGSLPLGKFVEQVEKISAERGLRLRIRVPDSLVPLTPEPLLGPKPLVPDILEIDRDDPDFLSRLWKALSDCGVQMGAFANGEFMIRPRSVEDNLGDVMTTEVRVSRGFLDKVSRGKPSPDAPVVPSPSHAIIEPGIRFPRGSLVIFSRSTSTLTIRAPRWRFLSILALVEQIEKGEIIQKSKLKK